MTTPIGSMIDWSSSNPEYPRNRRDLGWALENPKGGVLQQTKARPFPTSHWIPWSLGQTCWRHLSRGLPDKRMITSPHSCSMLLRIKLREYTLQRTVGTGSGLSKVCWASKGATCQPTLNTQSGIAKHEPKLWTLGIYSLLRTRSKA